jgi:hydrophobic/amphiphilic exporter-1 (mainly G- bacteria), HAE1 family
MKSATKFSLKNPVAIIILSLLFVLGGLYSFNSLKVDLLPDITFPQLSVQVVYPGASPQDVNEQVTTPVEQQLKVYKMLKL